MNMRKATVKDAARLADYKNRIINQCPYISRSKPTDVLKESKLLKSKNRLIVVCEASGVMAGVCRIKKAGHKGMISITIMAPFRGKNLGKNLLSKAMKESKNKFKTKLFIANIYSENSASIKFFERNGFQLAGKIPKGFRKNGKYHDKLIYVRV